MLLQAVFMKASNHCCNGKREFPITVWTLNFFRQPPKPMPQRGQTGLLPHPLLRNLVVARLFIWKPFEELRYAQVIGHYSVHCFIPYQN